MNMAGRIAKYLATSLAMENRSEEHTSELQSLRHLVCRLLLEKKEIRDDIDAGGSSGCAAEFKAQIVGAGEGEVASDILIGAAADAELIVGIGGIGGAGEPALCGRRGDPKKLLRIGERKRAEHERVNDAEDRDVGSDGQCKDEHGDGRKSGLAAQRTQSVFQVLQKNVETHKTPCLPLLFSCLLHRSEERR